MELQRQIAYTLASIKEPIQSVLQDIADQDSACEPQKCGRLFSRSKGRPNVVGNQRL